MREVIFKVPAELTPRTVLRFAHEIESVDHADRYVFDLKAVQHVEPFGMLMGGALLRQFARQRKKQENIPEFKAINYGNNSYASFMGFYKSFGLNYGKAPGEAMGSRGYIPITRLRAEAIYSAARRDHRVVGEAIEAESERIASVLTQQQSGDLVDTLTYSIREIFRNVLEHAGADCIWYAAQFWPTRKKVEIAILDEGIGIKAGLARNPRYADLNDQNALHLALQPGVSGVAREGNRTDNDPWANSGYGLYMTSAICQRGGEFLLCSGSKALFLGRSDKVEFQDTVFRGTAIRMVLDTSKVQKISSTLSEIHRAGQALAQKGQHGANLSASMISRMLARRPTEATDDSDWLAPGVRVVHPSFGPGMVLDLQNGNAVRVMFDDAGTKTLAIQYAGLRPE